MSSRGETQERLQKPDLPDNWFEGQKSYNVVLDGVRTEMETPESFAIKFSLLSRVPVTKTKHIVAHMPATIWSGAGRQKAERILSLVEEAGGLARIVDGSPEPPARSPQTGPKPQLTCRWCGFPLKDKAMFCEFCMTPVQEGEKGGAAPSRARAVGISLKRLLVYLSILVVGIIILVLLR